MLNISYRTNKLEKVCSNFGAAKKEYGEEMACKIDQRIGELKSTDSIETLIRYSIGRCHSLKGNRVGQYAMDLVHPLRLVFEHNGYEFELVNIVAIEDYH
ncbi:MULTISPECIES: type II toxin-antitoxin system RelE/ParE family toxin [unclassified Lacrimispora]|uniref:type II toxin-antitoxin system RelE/ParE family toxin n=1 Tax=unclassified Lacrimispora TaxID=2719232 RepID=UPI0037702392